MIKKTSYHWLPVNPKKDKFLKLITNILDDVEYFTLATEDKVSRLAADGMWMLKGNHKGKNIAVCWCDFRVKGASFSSANATRLTEYLAQLTLLNIPLAFSFESLGFRFMEGRNSFSQVFGLVPSLEKFRQKNLLITICKGKCLGIGAILYGLGHYRIAATSDATLNLTGPEVFKQFFGKKIDFVDVASAETLINKTGLIHEIMLSIADALSYAVNLSAQLQYRLPLPKLTKPMFRVGSSFIEKNSFKADLACFDCMQHISDNGIELFKGYDERLRAFILDFRGQHLAVLINPPDQMNNMFSFRTLEMYQHALKVFSTLRLPMVVLLDTPGIDPRFDGSNQGTIEKLISLTGDILNYPMPTVGVVNGRGYGGANTLLIPKCYGSVANYGIQGRANLDVMHESIMRELLSGSKDLLNSWETMRESQEDNCSDLVKLGLLDEIISYEDLANKLWHDLFANTEPSQTTVYAKDLAAVV